MSLGFGNLRRRAILLAAMAGPAFGETPVRVRLYDYAGVPPRILEQAQAYASTLFSEAGIAMEWARCSPGESGVPGDAACRPPFDPLNLEIRILSREMAKRAHTREHALGYALLAPGFHHVAAVFYHRALELEKGLPGRPLRYPGRGPGPRNRPPPARPAPSLSHRHHVRSLGRRGLEAHSKGPPAIHCRGSSRHGPHALPGKSRALSARRGGTAAAALTKKAAPLRGAPLRYTHTLTPRAPRTVSPASPPAPPASPPAAARQAASRSAAPQSRTPAPSTAPAWPPRCPPAIPAIRPFRS